MGHGAAKQNGGRNESESFRWRVWERGVARSVPLRLFFGGKSKVADIVWAALGQPAHYLEPFFGSGAVLLSRPEFTGGAETICDANGFVANVWRAIQFSPDEAAKWCDWPVSHIDLIARRNVLIKNEHALVENLSNDDMWCDPKLAGYWIWAASCWIGSGLTRPNAIPHIASKGSGVHATGQIPHISHKGKGVHALKSEHIYDWMRRLSARLRRVRVVCGDWSRVCGGNWQDSMGTCAIFLDPPYGVTDRDGGIYGKHDSVTVSKDVREWALGRADNPKYRIVIAGYYEEHESLLSLGWRVHKWSAGGGYANMGKLMTRGKENRHREALFFSPRCLDQEGNQGNLF